MIVVAGEALVDLVPQGSGGPAAALLPSRGGGPCNTAVALARLGSPAHFCSRVSTDAFGDFLLDRLRAENVGLDLVRRGPEPTTLAVAALDGAHSAAYRFFTEGTADRLFTAPPELPGAARALLLGSCSLVLEPGATAYETLMRHAAARGVFIALDPNIRPGLIPDPGAYRARFTGWLPHLDVVKLSEEDARWLGGEVDDWLAAGPAAVVVTRGRAGLTVVTRDHGTVDVPAWPVDVVDTIGAGDTVYAALLHGLSERNALTRAALSALTADDWRALLTFAAHAAALTCSRAGAEPPYATEIGDPAAPRRRRPAPNSRGGAGGRPGSVPPVR
ncbi:carbohydrate kinase family protein [Streptomyces litchfieldiae]|uniref:Carbohydrate kinase n=1 Tax=Streptomyces litchfieldiae TaxID=3075543 RepID=A0ABU2MU42_9ACTN|nr:carbohydrate kinase [Streptomyces sp. DSM 44938]MDT0345060.1 carbohydrate kinase [Streptomyces sp. DSM 44938]